MPAKPKLSVVTEATAPKKPGPPKSLREAAEGEDYLEILVAQRREMIRDVADVSGPAKAALHRQIALASKEIALLQDAKRQEAIEDGEGEPDDEDFDAEAL